MTEKIIYSADQHGNITQYKKILAYSRKVNADLVIFGGDLTPKEPARRTPKKQRQFLIDELFPLLDVFREQSNSPVLFIMGNDDFRSNYKILADGQQFHGYRMIDQIPYITRSGHTIIGYSWVPFTPFQYKCWEKRDCIEDTDFQHRPDTRQEGVSSHEDKLLPCILDPLNGSSIEDDLEMLMKGYDPEKTIIVSHAPPYDTVCDMVNGGHHVGSRGLRKFIDNRQPVLTLHGHIHETVDISGSFSERNGKTFSLAVGNDNRVDDPHVLEIDILDQGIAFSRKQLVF